MVQRDNPETEWEEPYLPPLENKPIEEEVEPSFEVAAEFPPQSKKTSPKKESINELRTRRKRGRPIGSLTKISPKSKSIYKPDRSVDKPDRSEESVDKPSQGHCCGDIFKKVIDL